MSLRLSEPAGNIGMAVRLPVPLAALLLLLLTISRGEAQHPGSLAAERARLAEITGDTTQLVSRYTSLASLMPVTRRLLRDDTVLRVVPPELRLIHNSGLPYSLNDGPLWAGRGWNLSFTGGLAYDVPYRSARIRIVAAPTIVYSQNLPFQIFPNTTPGRSTYANPFHGAPVSSLDLPHRFGDRHLLTLDAGRSSLAVALPKVTFGVTAENEWWGPAIRNTLVMSNSAPGVPRWFVRTTQPIRTRAGLIDAKLISGVLTQSLFFDPNASENRTLSGIRVALQPAFDSTLTFGFSRVVYVPVGPFASPFTAMLSHALDALTRWENLDPHTRSDQIYSVFARWIFPPSGFEVYGEWARMALPRTITEVLTAGHYTGGFTLGFQWAQPREKSRYLRLQAEVTYLEQSIVSPGDLHPDFYSGIASPQGYTQRGQVIGAAIGPGSSSQFIGLDYLRRDWQAGAFIGRIRWDNDAMYRSFAPTFFKHDVSIMSGLRGAWRAPFTDFSADLTVARRLNYLFQNGFANPGRYRDVDVTNITLALVATPR
jgi:hypothetical protein